jgi:hypothetical protein
MAGHRHVKVYQQQSHMLVVITMSADELTHTGRPHSRRRPITTYTSVLNAVEKANPRPHLVEHSRVVSQGQQSTMHHTLRLTAH